MKQNSDTNFVCNNQMLIWQEVFQSPQQKLPWTNHPQDNFACTKEEAEVHSLEHDVRTCSWVKCRKQGLFPLDSLIAPHHTAPISAHPGKPHSYKQHRNTDFTQGSATLHLSLFFRSARKTIRMYCYLFFSYFYRGPGLKSDTNLSNSC